MEIARSIAASLDAFLIDRVARVAARCSTPTGSTPGNPSRKRRSEVSFRTASSRWAGSGTVDVMLLILVVRITRRLLKKTPSEPSTITQPLVGEPAPE
jgi:hypothetical protein